jgi:hypothetical protein
LTSRTFLKIKNTQQHIFLFRTVKTNIKGALWKITKNSVKHVHDLRLLSIIKECELINYKSHGCIYMHQRVLLISLEFVNLLHKGSFVFHGLIWASGGRQGLPRWSLFVEVRVVEE